MAKLTTTQSAGRPFMLPSQHAEMRVLLAALFPAVFSGSRKPLKIGIDQDLHLALAGTQYGGLDQVQAFLARWTRLYPYVKAIAQGGARYDLTGQPEGTVSAAARSRAQAAMLSFKETGPPSVRQRCRPAGRGLSRAGRP